jgi:hypothetical protein
MTQFNISINDRQTYYGFIHTKEFKIIKYIDSKTTIENTTTETNRANTQQAHPMYLKVEELIW